MERQDVVVRRARARDAERVAAFFNRAMGGRVAVDAQAVTERLGDVGLLLAERGDVLKGVMGWNVENLVVSVTDMLIWPARERESVGRVLFNVMEASAADLQAEAALLLLPPHQIPDVLDYCQALGYGLRRVDELPRAWRDVARRAGREEEEQVLVKRLRSNRVVRPL